MGIIWNLHLIMREETSCDLTISLCICHGCKNYPDRDERISLLLKEEGVNLVSLVEGLKKDYEEGGTSIPNLKIGENGNLEINCVSAILFLNKIAEML